MKENEDIVLFDEADKLNSPSLMPQYSASRRLAERITNDISPKIFDDIIKKSVDDLYTKLSDTVNDYILSDQEINLPYYISNMVEQTIQALLTGEEWAMKAYPYADYYKGEKIREAVAKHGKDTLLMKRIDDLEKELKNTKEQLVWARK